MPRNSNQVIGPLCLIRKLSQGVWIYFKLSATEGSWSGPYHVHILSPEVIHPWIVPRDNGTLAARSFPIRHSSSSAHPTCGSRNINGEVVLYNNEFQQHHLLPALVVLSLSALSIVSPITPSVNRLFLSLHSSSPVDVSPFIPATFECYPIHLVNSAFSLHFLPSALMAYSLIHT